MDAEVVVSDLTATNSKVTTLDGSSDLVSQGWIDVCQYPLKLRRRGWIWGCWVYWGLLQRPYPRT